MSIRMLRVGVLDSCRFQKEHHFSEPNIEAIAADLREGSKAILNPIHVIPKGGGRWEIVAGHDRVEAAKRTELTEIPVRDFGTVLLTGEQVYEHWRRDNVLRKQPDRELATEETLLDWKGEWSDRRIAVDCGVSPTFVGKIRARLQTEGRLSTVDSREGVDGRTTKPRTVRKDVPSRRGIPHPTATVPSRAAAPAAELKTPESSSGSTDSSSPGGGSEVGIDRPVSGFDPRDQTEPNTALDLESAGAHTTEPKALPVAPVAENDSAGATLAPVGTPLSVGDGGLAEVRAVLGLSMRQLTKVELLAMTDDEETRLTAIGRYCQQIVTRRRLVCEEAAKEAAKGAAA